MLFLEISFTMRLSNVMSLQSSFMIHDTLILLGYFYCVTGDNYWIHLVLLVILC